MPFKPDDIVRIIKVDAGTMIESYLGYEGRVIAQKVNDLLYMVELDVGRANVDRAGQLGPRFVVREDQIDSDVTEKMIEAGDRIVEEHRHRNPSMDIFGENEVKAIYRAMRAARFER